MANLRTRNVFIDTEVFVSANFNFQWAAFGELVRLAQAGFIRVFLTTITVGEVHAHISEKISEAASGLKEYRSERGRVLQNVPKYDSIFEKVDKEQCVNEIKGKFDQFLKGARVTILDTQSVKAEEVFKDYFGLKPPFGEGRKKLEFPDAFAQHALANWCEQQKEEMYVVSADKDWKTDKKSLITLEKLREFIDAALKDQAEKLAQRVLQIYEKHLDKVEKAIEDAFKDAGFYTSDVDGEVNGVTVSQISLGKALVLDVDRTSATISVDVKVHYTADVSYLSDSDGIWDSEDHEWSYRPTKYACPDESVRFEAELEIEYNPNNEDRFQVSCHVGETFDVTVIPTDYELK
jgi:PIN domain